MTPEVKAAAPSLESGAKPEIPHPLSKRAVWNLILAITGLIYIVMVLSLEIESPVFVALFILLAGNEVVTAHSRKNQRG